ncbi:MAG: hypothetical protein KAT62_13935 [Desulfuromonadales bacterium]|nr:hypothetical protein [Desulfuromonadales bacterium]
MSQVAQVTQLLTDTLGSFIHFERLSAAATAIVPGMLVEESAGKVQEHSTAAANAQKLFALTDLPIGGTIDDIYAVGAGVRYGAAHSGQLVSALVAAGALAIADGDALESAGNGTLRKAVADAATDTAQRDSIVGYAVEAVDNSGGGSSVRIQVRVA